jgi:formylglycine-generating enzyme required for sulfatase activity
MLFQCALTMLLALGVAACEDSAAPEVSVSGVSLSKTSISLTVGATETLAATIVPTDATNKTISWTSSNTAAATVDATVDADGFVTAIAVGAADITVTTQDGGKKATCTVTVHGTDIATDKTFTANGISFIMVGVVGGTFNMGEVGIAEPVHSVTLSSFMIGKTEITQELWLAVMGAHDETQDVGSGNNYPEYYVSWNDIVGTGATTGYTVNGVAYKTDGFCYKLSQLVGGGRQFFLPTEAQ